LLLRKIAHVADIRRRINGSVVNSHGSTRMNHKVLRNQVPGHSRLLFGIAIFVVAAGASGWWLFAESWTGIKPDGDKIVGIGTYRSLDACRSDVEKTGGWCGKGCKDYGGAIAGCNPDLPIPKN
jgi:hypothetical protein